MTPVAPAGTGAEGLAAQIREAEERVAVLKARSGAATCAEMGEHDWRHIGGRNAGCSDECCCSVPIYECARCRDCDYGDNTEAAETRQECADDAAWELTSEDHIRAGRLAIASRPSTPAGRAADADTAGGRPDA